MSDFPKSSEPWNILPICVRKPNMEAPDPRQSSPCPSERVLLELVRGELDPERLASMLAHTESCASCELVVAEAGLAITAEAGDLLEQTHHSTRGLFAPGQLIASRYRIQARIGRGGMGEVYLAIDEELGERVALKTIASALGSDPILVEHFKQELRLARKVSHPNVCRTLEFGRHELEAGLSQCFFTMQFIDGVTLRRRLVRSGAFELPEALATVRDLALGLQAIHDQNIVHRDIKPDNVMLAVLAPDERGRAPVPLWLDFGVARVDLRESVSRGLLAGTPDYVAPELLAGKVATRASDVYALGLVLYEMLVGDLRFARVDSFLEAVGRPNLGLPAPSQLRAGLPAALDQLVLECLCASPEGRPTSALAVAERVRAIEVAPTLGNDSHPARSPSVTLERATAAGSRGRFSRAAWLLLAAGVAIATLGARFALAPRTPLPAANDRDQSASNAAPLSPVQPTLFESYPAVSPGHALPTSPPAESARPKLKRSKGSEKPQSTPSASASPHSSSAPPHSVSEFGGRR
jgi:serine/threonine protein kinase